MSQSDKIKAGAAAALLLVAAFLIYWFGFRSSTDGADLTKVEAAPITATKDGPPPAANRRVPPGAK
jgi:hypothetical protein